MRIQKFGGTSVGSAERIRKVADLIIESGGKNIIVLSAMSGTTNSLIEISTAIENNDLARAESLINELENKYKEVVESLYETDGSKKKAHEIIETIFKEIREITHNSFNTRLSKVIVSKGEILSTNLMQTYLEEKGISSLLLDALELIKTDENDEPDITYTKKRIRPILEANPEIDTFIIQGFICKNHKGETHNLQRGGSDYTASILGVAVNADVVDIWTDIDGMHDNDPRYVEETSPVHNLHFEEAAELAYFGAKILHPTCILPAKLNNVPVRLLNTMDPDAEGTLINNDQNSEGIKAVAAKDNITAIKIKSSRMLLAYGFLKKVFEVFEKYKTPIDMITTSEVGVSLTIDNDSHLQDILTELEEFGTVTIDKDMVIVCVVGNLDWKNKGYEAKALDALRNIPVRMISYGGSNYNISFLIRKEDKIKALRLLSYHLF